MEINVIALADDSCTAIDYAELARAIDTQATTFRSVYLLHTGEQTNIRIPLIAPLMQIPTSHLLTIPPNESLALVDIPGLTEAQYIIMSYLNAKTLSKSLALAVHALHDQSSTVIDLGTLYNHSTSSTQPMAVAIPQQRISDPTIRLFNGTATQLLTIASGWTIDTPSPHPPIGNQRSISLSVVLATIDATSKRCQQLLHALHTTTRVPFETILVENFSPLQGFTAPVNNGIAAATGDSIVVMNDDVLPLHNWWEPLDEALNQGFPLVTPTTIEGDRQDFSAWCFAFKKETLPMLGPNNNQLFDPDLQIWFQDTDLYLRLLSLGIRPRRVPMSVISHVASQSISTSQASLHEWIYQITRLDKQHFSNTWGPQSLELLEFRDTLEELHQVTDWGIPNTLDDFDTSTSTPNNDDHALVASNSDHTASMRPIRRRRTSTITTPIVINCRDRLTTLRSLIQWLTSDEPLRIILLDNNSSYQPLLDFYNSTDLEVVRLSENLGPYALWKSGICDQLQLRGRVVYTDADVVPSSTIGVQDTLDALHAGLDAYKRVSKVGLSLKIDDLPDSYKLKDQVIHWEHRFWTTPISDSAYIAPIDTTFALYRDISAPFSYSAIRLAPPYVARHLPWYVDSLQPDDEELYYQTHAVRTMSSWGIEVSTFAFSEILTESMA